MIKYRLQCGEGHQFEGWFKGSEGFETQKAQGFLACPHCGDTNIDRALMAPAVQGTRKANAVVEAEAAELQSQAQTPSTTSDAPSLISPEDKAKLKALKALRDHMLSKSDNVGAGFAEEARKIHYGETEARGIHGEATKDEVKSLVDEGIEISPIPIFPDERN